MLRRVTFLMAVCMFVGSAFGAANKIRYFTPSPVQVAESVAALGPEADPDGMAILNYAAGADKTIVQIIVSDMTPNLTYHVRLTDGASDPVEVLDAFTVNEEGHGTFHQEFLGADISTYDVELFVGTTASGVVWSQLQDPNNLPSYYANTSMDVTERAADNIQFDAAQEITAIRWWGSWCNAAPLADEFRIRFYDLIVPGVGGTDNVVYEELIVPTTKVSVGVPPVPVCADAPDEFEFEADLPVAFSAAANTTYWVEVVGCEQANNPVFNWSNATGGPEGNGAGLQWSYSFSKWLTGYPDRAFQLVGEADTTELRAHGHNPG